jgi:hypothetical protein
MNEDITKYKEFCGKIKWRLYSMSQNFRSDLDVVFFLLGDTPASEFYISTFLNTLSVPSL